MGHVDQKYIDALLNNDEVLLREIYEKFSNKIKRMVLQQGGNENDAADVMQDALLAILNRAKKGNFVLTCPFEGFLYLICKRKWIKELKRTDRLKVTINNDSTFDRSDTSSGLAEECMLFEERKVLIVRILKKMGVTCRELLYLSWEDKSMEEVAAILNISYGYARKKKSECMAKLIDLIHQSPEYNYLK